MRASARVCVRVCRARARLGVGGGGARVHVCVSVCERWVVCVSARRYVRAACVRACVSVRVRCVNVRARGCNCVRVCQCE